MSTISDEHVRNKDAVNNPINYKEVGKFEITKKIAINMIALLAVGLIVFGFLFTAIYTLITGNTTISGDFSPESILVATFLFIFTVIFHELIHGLFISIYGGTPRYGWEIAHKILPYFYATTDTRFQRNQFAVISISPLFVISLVCIILMVAFPVFAQWMLIPLILNSTGAVCDLWMTIISLRYPKNVLVQDNIIDLTFYGMQSDNTTNISINSLTWNFLKGSTIAFTVIIILNLIFQFYIFFNTGKTALHISFVQLLPVCGFIGLVYSIIKSTRSKKFLDLHKVLKMKG